MKHFFKKYFVFFFLLVNLNVFALQERTVSPRTCSIEATLFGVDISISSYDGEAISYSADIKNDIKAIYFTSSMCEGNVSITRSIFKVASLCVASGNIKLDADITSACDFCFSEVKANLALKGLLSDFNFFYPYEIFSSCLIDGKTCTKEDKFKNDRKKKKRLGITQTSSKTILNFVAR